MMYSLRNETRNCQVCMKPFPNGRALGGHMRSHTRILSASATGSTVPPLKTPTKLGANINETVLMRSVHARGVGREQDLKREEGGQCKRKIVVDLDECDQSSLTAVEEGALCLVAMSKGERPANSQNWNAIDRLLSKPNDKEENTRKSIDKYSDEDDKEDKFVAELDEDEDDDYETCLVSKEKQCKKRFTCDICGKVLHSYQALGGHRTSHRTKQLKICDKNDQDMVGRHYDCNICGRVFESGQALGGHMKIHYVFL